VGKGKGCLFSEAYKKKGGGGDEGRYFYITLLLMAVDFVNLRRVKNHVL